MRRETGARPNKRLQPTAPRRLPRKRLKVPRLKRGRWADQARKTRHLKMAHRNLRVHVQTRAWLFTAVLAASIAACTAGAPPAPPAELRTIVATGSEMALKPGPFSPFPTIALGEPIRFDNEISSPQCYPLFVMEGVSEDLGGKRFFGRILLWLTRAHVVGTRVFVRPCEQDSGPETLSSAAVIQGGASKWWFEATLVDAPTHPRLNLRRLALEGFHSLSSEALCGQRVAYWSSASSPQAEGVDLTARVADIFDDRALLSRAMGHVLLETDDPRALPAPTWRSDCLAVTFAREGQHDAPFDVP